VVVTFRRALGLALALSLIAVGACGAAEPPLSVRVLGSKLVDGRGNSMRLLGVNRSSAEYACRDRHSDGPFEGPTDEPAIAAMTAWRINAVRIPLNEHCWLGINGVPVRYSAADYRAGIAAYAARLHAAGLYVVLDLHWNAAGTAPAGGQKQMADLDHAPRFWSSVARAFKSDPAVVFDLYNEPNGVDWRCWRDGCVVSDGWRTAGMATLVRAVRSTGARQPIIATGLGHGSDLSSWLRYRPRDPANQLAAGFHVYDFTACSDPGCWRRNITPVASRVPVVTTEFGEKACSGAFLDRFMSWADTAGVSYLGWSWNPAGCAAPSLITSWDGQATTSGQRFRTHLAGVAARRG
jgi:hypothetical protein